MPPARIPERDVYFKFFPRDWRGDELLQTCSLAARGLWVELLCVAHKSRGLVRVNGMSPTIRVLAKQVRADPNEVRRLLKELTNMGVCSVLADGTICSRRMIRDAKRREINRKNGLRGGSPHLLSGAKTQEPAIRLTESDKPSVKAIVHRSIVQRSRTPPLPPLAGGAAVNWREECEQKHDGRCGNRTFHTAKMAEERES
jgi:hypothetical protein